MGDHRLMSNERTSELRVAVNDSSERCSVSLRNLESGKTFGPSSLLAIEAYDRALLRVERVTDFLVQEIKRVDDALHLIVRDKLRGFSIGFWLRFIDGDTLSVTLPPAEIYEERLNLFRLFSIDLFPGLIASETAAEILLPLNTGVVCRTNEQPACMDRFLIYGEQARWELLPTMPVCALQTPAGGMVILAAQGAAETECRVATDGTGGSVGFSFYFRGTDVDPVELSPREIRFTPIPPARDITVFTADVLRTHVMRDLGKTTLIERAKESPEVRYLLQAYIMKLFYGVQAQGMMLNEDGRGDSRPFYPDDDFRRSRRRSEAFRRCGRGQDLHAKRRLELSRPRWRLSHPIPGRTAIRRGGSVSQAHRLRARIRLPDDRA